MRKALLAFTAAVAFAGAAQAAPVNFQGTYAVTANTADPGLMVSTANVASNPFSFNLDTAGDNTEEFTLFKIWTTENSVGDGGIDSDYTPKPISVAFNFTAPAPAFGGTATGETFGTTFGGWFDAGHVEWDNPLTINFGPNNDGILKIWLSDETFNQGLWDTIPGPHKGAYVDVKFKLVQDATPAEVPEPVSLLLLGSGLAGLGLMRRRRAA